MRHWWSDQRDSVPWTSGIISVAATATLFATSYVAMKTVRFTELDVPRRDRGQTTVIQLTPPVAPVEPAPPVRRREPPIRPAPVTVATPVPLPAAPVTQPVDVAPTVRADPVRDTSAGASAAPASPNRSFTDLVPLREIPTFPRGGSGTGAVRGAPIAAAGVTAHAGTVSTAARDSIITGKMIGIPVTAARFKLTPAEREAIRQQNEPGLPAYGRAARLPGGAVSVPLMNGGFSVAHVAVSSGGGSYDRRASDSIDADIQRHLRRMQDRLALLRDSIRADSLRRDSLERARVRP